MAVENLVFHQVILEQDMATRIQNITARTHFRPIVINHFIQAILRAMIVVIRAKNLGTRVVV